MGREAWVYAIAFVAVLALGAALIVPRLQRFSAPELTPQDPSGPPQEVPRASPTGPVERTWYEIEVRGPQGPLVGPLRSVEGAEVEWLTAADALQPRLRIRLLAPRVGLGAIGHRWRFLEERVLAESTSVVLERGAAPIVIRVREADGDPAPGIPVEILPPRPGPMKRTGDGGTVVVDDATPGLVVARIGARERQGPTLRLLAGRDRNVEAVLEPAWTVRGQVVDRGGLPAAGVDVRGLDAEGALGASARTDTDGRFVWRGPVRAAVAIRLTDPGRAMTSIEVRPPAWGRLETDAGLVKLSRPCAAIEGRVLRAVGAGRGYLAVEPAAAAVLRELFGADAVLDAPRTVTLSAQGEFRVAELPSGLPLRVSVRGAGLPLDDVLEASPGDVLQREYSPDAGQVLHGGIRDLVTGGDVPAGHLVRVSVVPREQDVTLPGDREVRTDASGRFVVEGLSRGTVFLRVHHPDRRTLLEEVRLPRSRSVDLNFTARPSDPARRLTGVVVDDLDTPLPGVTVRAAGRQASTDDVGRFVLDDVESFGEAVQVDATYEAGTPATVDPTPYVPGARRRVRIGTAPVSLVLARAARLRFRALDGLDDVPLALVHVVLRTEDGRILVDRTVATHDGEVFLRGLRPVGARLSLFAPRHRLVVPAVVLSAATETDLGDLRLGRGIHVTGRILDPRGQPVPGARISGVESGWLQRRGGDPTPERELAFRYTRADEAGRFELDGFDPRAPGLLAAWAPGYAPVARRVILEKFQDAANAHLEIRLRRGGYLQVELLEKGTERPIPGAFFDLEHARSQSDYLDLLRRGVFGGSVASDEDWVRASAQFLTDRGGEGTYRLGPIAPGAYDVLVDHPDYRALRRKLTVLDPSESPAGLDVVAGRSLIETLRLIWEMEPAR